MSLRQHDSKRELEAALLEKVEKTREYFLAALPPDEWRIEKDCVIQGATREARGYSIWIKSSKAEQHFEHLRKGILVGFDPSLTRTTDGETCWFVGLGEDHKSAHAG